MSQFIYKKTDTSEELVVTGELNDACANIGYMIHRLHSGILQNSPDAAKIFRTAIIQMVTDPDLGIWEKAESSPGEVLIAHVSDAKEK